MSVQFFGTIFKPNVRYECPFVARLSPPIREVELLSCRKCHKTGRLTVDLNEVPRVWGGKKEAST